MSRGDDTALAVRGGEAASLDAAAGDELGDATLATGGCESRTRTRPPSSASSATCSRRSSPAGLLGAYVLGRIIHGVWASLANRDFFSQNLPALAAVQDDTKTTIGIVIGGVISLGLSSTLYRRPDVRTGPTRSPTSSPR